MTQCHLATHQTHTDTTQLYVCLTLHCELALNCTHQMINDELLLIFVSYQLTWWWCSSWQWRHWGRCCRCRCVFNKCELNEWCTTPTGLCLHTHWAASRAVRLGRAGQFGRRNELECWEDIWATDKQTNHVISVTTQTGTTNHQPSSARHWAFPRRYPRHLSTANHHHHHHWRTSSWQRCMVDPCILPLTLIVYSLAFSVLRDLSPLHTYHSFSNTHCDRPTCIVNRLINRWQRQLALSTVCRQFLYKVAKTILRRTYENDLTTHRDVRITWGALRNHAPRSQRRLWQDQGPRDNDTLAHSLFGLSLVLVQSLVSAKD